MKVSRKWQETEEYTTCNFPPSGAREVLPGRAVEVDQMLVACRFPFLLRAP
ncbi:MAG: hypothetical protein GX073_00280 [Firmicutes bacterium]|nr:hypothetical protein [Bacillota bacterium]